MTKTTAQNGRYVYITQNELNTLRNAVKTNGAAKNILDNIQLVLDKQQLIDTNKYVSAAETKFSKLKLDASNLETILIDDDANVPIHPDGAYIQVWGWIDGTKDIKVKRATRSKKVTTEG
jgi:hypothetical protein